MISQLPTYQLQIGELMVSFDPSIINTILGSCVSVCLFSETKKIGGMIHYAHPSMALDFGQAADFRYGDIAIPTLIEEMEKATGEAASTFVAKIVGGASDGYSVGPDNVRIAKELLQKYKIPIIAEDTGGPQGRRVRFHTTDGRLQVANISSKKPRKVLVVDSSKAVREFLQRILQEDPELELVGLAENPIQADQLVERTKPDVITLEINLPMMSGIQWLEKLLPSYPIPVVMISAQQLHEGSDIFRALEMGAVDYIPKPTLSELDIAGSLIREKIKAASFAKVRLQQSSNIVNQNLKNDLDLNKLLVIGASTGGTEAIKSLLCSLPANIPPTLIVQHIPSTFSKAFADRLNELCPFDVKEARDADEVLPSRVLIAPGGKQMKLQRTTKGSYCVRITDDPPVSSHKPSVDYLFHSVAKEAGRNVIGVILTGMGSDGAKGLLALRKIGAQTLGQDEESCVVYGMPRVAFELGAVEKVVSLNRMPSEIINRLARKKAA